MAKPVFLYCHGTAYTFGLDFERVQGLLAPIGSTFAVRGLNGLTKPWNGSVPRDPFPDLVNKDFYEVRRVNYPAAQLAMGVSIGIGATAVINQITDLPAGTPFALGGFSQGAAVMSTVLGQLQTGSLTSRYSQLLGGVMFGNPRRMVNWRGPIGGTWSGAWDVPGSNTGGHGSFPTTGSFARLTSPPDTWVEFAAPADIFASVGDSPTGLNWTAGNALFIEQTLTNALNFAFNLGSGAVAAVIEAIALASIENFFVDPFGTLFPVGGNGHTVYPFLPPPNSDGTFNFTTVTSGGINYRAPVGLTCYQLALQFLEGIANTWNTVPIIVPPKVETVTGWQPTLTSVGSPTLSAGWSTTL